MSDMSDMSDCYFSSRDLGHAAHYILCTRKPITQDSVVFFLLFCRGLCMMLFIPLDFAIFGIGNSAWPDECGVTFWPGDVIIE